MTVRIQTQEFIRNGRYMYRVTGIKGVMKRERLDPEYISAMPSFWLTQSGRTIKLYDGTTLSINGEYRKPVFARILKEINRGGDRLHEINREKYIAKIASNVQKIVKARENKRDDTTVRSRTFKV